MAGCRTERSPPPDKRGTVSDAGRGGRWAPSTTICTITSAGKLATRNWHRESVIGAPHYRESAIGKGRYREGYHRGGSMLEGSISGRAGSGATKSTRTTENMKNGTAGDLHAGGLRSADVAYTNTMRPINPYLYYRLICVLGRPRDHRESQPE